MTYQSIAAFFDRGIIINFQRLVETESEFPAVTFCNLNAFDPATNQYVGNYLMTRLKENNIQPKIEVNASETPSVKLDLLQSLLKAIIITEKNFTAYNLTLKDIGFSLDTMLISCFYNGVKCYNKDFVYYYTYEYGNCFTFNKNSSSIRKTKLSGPGTGLQLEIFVGVPGFFKIISCLFI